MIGIDIVKQIAMGFFGLCYGLLSAAGVFTVFVAVALVPRFAGKTRTAAHVMHYEDMVVLGTVVGGVLTVFEKYCYVGEKWRSFCQSHWQPGLMLSEYLGQAILIIFALCCGLFIGCLALAIAEMLDTIPIFFRRVGFQGGVSLAIFWVAMGKVFGSLLYFLWEFSGI